MYGAVAARWLVAVVQVTRHDRCSSEDGVSCERGPCCDGDTVELEVGGFVAWDPVMQEWRVSGLTVLHTDERRGGMFANGLEEYQAADALSDVASDDLRLGRCVACVPRAEGDLGDPERRMADGEDWLCTQHRAEWARDSNAVSAGGAAQSRAARRQESSTTERGTNAVTSR